MTKEHLQGIVTLCFVHVCLRIWHPVYMEIRGFPKPNETALGPHVYQKGPPNRGGVGHVWVGWVMQGWGGSCRGGVGHVGWVGYVGVGWVMQGWGGLCRGGAGYTVVEWAVKIFTE